MVAPDASELFSDSKRPTPLFDMHCTEIDIHKIYTVLRNLEKERKGLQLNNIHNICRRDYSWDQNKTAFVLRRAVHVGLVIKITYKNKTTYRFAKHFRGSSTASSLGNNDGTGLTSSIRSNDSFGLNLTKNSSSFDLNSSILNSDSGGLTSHQNNDNSFLRTLENNDSFTTMRRQSTDSIEDLTVIREQHCERVSDETKEQLLAFEEFKKDIDEELKTLKDKINKLNEGHEFLCSYFDSPKESINGDNTHASESLTITIPAQDSVKLRENKNESQGFDSANKLYDSVYKVSSMGIHGDSVNIETKFNDSDADNGFPGTRITMKFDPDVKDSYWDSETITDVSEATTYSYSILSPSHSEKASSTNTYTLDKCYGSTLPNMENAAPYMEGKLPNMDSTTPYMEGTLPNMENAASYMEGKLPNMDSTAPNMEGTLPNMESEQNVKTKMLALKECLQEEISHIKEQIEEINIKQVEMFHTVNENAEELAAEIIEDARTLHSIRNKRSLLPNMGNTFPNMEEQSPNREYNFPNMEIKSPNKEYNLPNIERQSPSREYDFPHKENETQNVLGVNKDFPINENTLEGELNRGMPYSPSRENDLSLQKGTLSTYEGSPSPNKGSLSLNKGSLSPNKGSLSPNKGSLSPNKGSLSPNVNRLTRTRNGATKNRVRFSLDTSYEEDSLQTEKDREAQQTEDQHSLQTENDRLSLKAENDWSLLQTEQNRFSFKENDKTSNSMSRLNNEEDQKNTESQLKSSPVNTSPLTTDQSENVSTYQNDFTRKLIASNEKYLNATMGADLLWLIDNTMRNEDDDIMSMKNDGIMTLKDDDSTMLTSAEKDNLIKALKSYTLKNDTTMDSGIESKKGADSEIKRYDGQQLLVERLKEMGLSGEGVTYPEDCLNKEGSGPIHSVLFQVLRNRANSLQTLLYEKQSIIDFLSRYVDKHELTNDGAMTTHLTNHSEPKV